VRAVVVHQAVHCTDFVYANLRLPPVFALNDRYELSLRYDQVDAAVWPAEACLDDAVAPPPESRAY
jgi:hypothetical protein